MTNPTTRPPGSPPLEYPAARLDAWMSDPRYLVWLLIVAKGIVMQLLAYLIATNLFSFDKNHQVQSRSILKRSLQSQF